MRFPCIYYLLIEMIQSESIHPFAGTHSLAESSDTEKILGKIVRVHRYVLGQRHVHKMRGCCDL